MTDRQRHTAQNKTCAKCAAPAPYPLPSMLRGCHWIRRHTVFAKRRIFSVLTMAMIGLHAAAAEADDVASQTIRVCQNANLEAPDLSEPLQRIGWVPVDASDLSDQNIQGIAARDLVRHFAMGRAPAKRWLRQWELSLTNAAGTRRLVTTEDGSTFQTWFELPSSDSMLIIYTWNTPVLTNVTCEIVVAADIAQESFAKVAKGAEDSEVPEILPTPGKRFGDKDAGQFLQVTYANPSKIEALIEDDFPFIAFVTIDSHMRK